MRPAPLVVKTLSDADETVLSLAKFVVNLTGVRMTDLPVIHRSLLHKRGDALVDLRGAVVDAEPFAGVAERHPRLVEVKIVSSLCPGSHEGNNGDSSPRNAAFEIRSHAIRNESDR